MCLFGYLILAASSLGIILSNIWARLVSAGDPYRKVPPGAIGLCIIGLLASVILLAVQDC
jgi:hypothetical protein